MMTSKRSESQRTRLSKTLKSTASSIASSAYIGVTKLASTAKNIASIASSKAYKYLNKDIISKNQELIKNNSELIKEIKDLSESNIKSNNELRLKIYEFQNKLNSPDKTRFANLINMEFNQFLKTQEKGLSQSKINILKYHFINKIKNNFSELNQKFSEYPNGFLIKYEKFQQIIKSNYGNKDEIGSVKNIISELEQKMKIISSLSLEEINTILIRNNEFLLPLKKRVTDDEHTIDEFKNELNEFENEFDSIARRIFVPSALINLFQEESMQIHEESARKNKEEEIRKQQSDTLRQERLRRMREEELRRKKQYEEDVRRAQAQREQEQREQQREQQRRKEEAEREEQRRREQHREYQQRRQSRRSPSMLFKSDDIIKNAYEILELPNNATWNDVKKQFKKLSLQYHPDKNLNDKTAEEMMKKIIDARNILETHLNIHKGGKSKNTNKKSKSKYFHKKMLSKKNNKKRKNITRKHK
jgi:hypothetical protein